MDFGKLPIGFAMALAQNQAAMAKFGQMSEDQKQTVLSRAHNARSETEMRQLVSGLAGDNRTR